MLARPLSPDPDPIIYSTPLPSGAPAPLLNIDTALPSPAHGQPSAASLALALSLPSPSLSPSSAGGAEKSADYVYYQRRPDTLSSEGRARATAAKVKLESYYKVALETAIDLNVRGAELDKRAAALPDERREREARKHAKVQAQFLRLRRTKIGLADFRTVKVIGRGAFGEVRLVQKTDTGRVYAMKTLQKAEMLRRDQLAHVRAERDVLAESTSPWVVQLYYSFQDPLYLYLIMEFLPGGDLMTMLMKYDVFSEDVTRFYIAECIMAIDAVHKMGFIHRDIKPDNILIDKNGHLKLSDFGLSTGLHRQTEAAYYRRLVEEQQAGPRNVARNSVEVTPINLTMTRAETIATWKKNRRKLAYSTVGTPDYIAPEVFMMRGYGKECDWWSLGAIMFECVVGYPPFCSENASDTYKKIVQWPKHLFFPEDVHLSREAEDLMRRLMTWGDQRWPVEKTKMHAFFEGVEWNALRELQAPRPPTLSSITDTSYFPTEELADVPAQPAGVERLDADRDLAFLGFTFKRFTGVQAAI
ncbi:hypothetical protein HETIRDRAFT_108831 [Heterobasidion irregulare TC 32-1]|uniref:non-specific serine/threonine protein kinase n=1 Tax=Heterobasidion irregulare (strain TC 32-1) TaxID=747525 RepID=W4K9Y6_HETIT|nr:uncharacterized protein HETIRDRAFT_108831 [Heterobasidion irregulare TC 32-1]ETW82564.1 hypothetical protein HETIRDRAFT_108831 [Heterobasidion irregulare TC 32-1]